ncbi:MAG: TolC family protein, partial [Candidatus Firestonebacteria bacterium]|nr:TolC family protein [Candidatus Firestonebacteria bacterium]
MAFQHQSTPRGSASPVRSWQGLTLLLPLFLLAAAQAATAAVELTEKATIAAALKNNPVLRQAQAEVQAAKARLWEGASVFLPQISANGHYNRLSESQFPSDIPGLSGAFSPSMTSDRYYDAAWTIKQPLFTWGANLSRFAQANADYRLASEKFRQQREETVFQARELYYKALLASAAVLIARESLEVSWHRQRFTQEQETRGKTSRYEVSRADVAVTNDRVAVSRAEKDLKRSLSNLRSFIQSQEDPAVTGTIPSAPREYTPAQVLPRAQEHSPKILQARLALESARAEWRGAVSGWLPNVFAAYSRTWQRPE